MSRRAGLLTFQLGDITVKEIAGFTVKELVVIAVVAALVIVAFGKISFLKSLAS